MKSLKFILLLMMCLNLCDARRVLLMFPSYVKTETMMGDKIAKHLLDAGFEVIYITANPLRYIRKNMVQIDINGPTRKLPSPVTMENTVRVETTEGGVNVSLSTPDFDWKKIMKKSRGVQRIIDTALDNLYDFDVVIAQWIDMTPYNAIAKQFDCPFIWFTVSEPPLLHDKNFGTLFVNFYQEIADRIWYFIFDLNDNDDEWSMRIPRRMESNVFVIFGNFLSCLSENSLPSFIYKAIGGYHIDKHTKALDKDLQSIMDNAKHGVIYFNMGAYLDSKDEEMTTALCQMFAKLPHKVIWKLDENYNLTMIPSNVHVMHWAPQQSILAHPNCLVFINHGGTLSLIESVHFGVPIIGIPVIDIEHKNVKTAVGKGFALKVDLTMALAEDLEKAIDVMLRTPRYFYKVKEISKKYHSSGIRPAKMLVQLVEDVAVLFRDYHSEASGIPILLSYFTMFLAVACIKLFIKYAIYKIQLWKLREKVKQE